MTREEALAKLAELAGDSDTELAHLEADNVLCELLVSLGYLDVVEAYHVVEKWFA